MLSRNKAALSQISIAVALALLPIASIAASYFSARSLLIVVFVPLGLMAFAGVRRGGNDLSYALLIGSFSLSLLLASTSASRNLIGFDIHQEYYVYSQTIAGGWRPETALVYNSVMSISILPTVITLVTGIDGVLVFKAIFPILFSLVPVMLYMVYRKFLSRQAAFLSSFLFMSYPASYIELIALGRQEIAEIFLVFLLWIFLSPRLRETRPGKILTVLLTVGLVVSHYSLAFIYVLVLTVSIVLARVSRRNWALCTNGVYVLSVFLVLSWYLFTAGGAALSSLSGFALTLFTGLIQDFFNPLSRPSIIEQALGFSGALGLLHLANRVTQYLVVFSILIGFLIFAFRTQKSHVAKVFLPPMLVGLSLLLASVILPFFASRLNLFRTYHIALLFISPCFAYGVERLVSWLRRIRFRTHVPVIRLRQGEWRVFAATILLMYFLFVGGWAWAVSMDYPTSFVLDWQRMSNSQSVGLKASFFAEYTVAQDIQAAQWLKSYHSTTHSVCADFVSSDHVLNSYGGFAKYLPLITEDCSYKNDYVYLSVLNAVNGTGTRITSSGIDHFDVSEISSELAGMNVVYSGDAVVYLSP